MTKVGITGQSGFIGNHILNTLRLYPNDFNVIPFEKSFFDNATKLDAFVKNCDVIIHLASLNRHDDLEVLYLVNLELTQKLLDSLERTKSKPHVIISSSTQEDLDNCYGKSKKHSRELLEKWSNLVGATFTGLIIPNVFGPFCKPYYNSVISTFSFQLLNGEVPRILINAEIQLIYISELVDEILKVINSKVNISRLIVSPTKKIKVEDILYLLSSFKDIYIEKGEIPFLNSKFELNLFNTFRSYINFKNFYPIKCIQNIDTRGSFVEIIKLGINGQVSFSTSYPGVTRGNHFHTRKIERFIVIKGKALIQIRKIGSNEVLKFYIDGNEPSYIDIPIWYTHNLKNIGDEILYTNFWINEVFIQNDADTYFEDV